MKFFWPRFGGDFCTLPIEPKPIAIAQKRDLTQGYGESAKAGAYPGHKSLGPLTPSA
jgi:hypothetical protein